MLRFLTSGESHGQCLTAIIEGLPAGLPIDIDSINRQLARRQRGFGRGGRMQIERDTVEIVSGVRFGETIGSPLTLVITNRDWSHWQDRMAVSGNPQGEKVTNVRPGHADLSGILKYDRQDIRDILERASARETAARVAVGAIARQLLSVVAGIEIFSHVVNIGGVGLKKGPENITTSLQEFESDLGCVDAATEERMRGAILEAKQAGDTLGGIFEVIATKLLPGLGSHVHWERRLDTQLAGALMSIPAIKGIEFGEGFAYADLPGSQAHDEIFFSAEHGYYRITNHAGGIEGGMSNGENIVVRAVMKPIPTLMKPLNSVNIETHTPVKANTERSDVCAVSAAAVVGEAMTAFILAQSLLDKFGCDNIADIQTAINSYRQRIYG